MTPLTYYARIESQGADGFLVGFPDVPEALTEGETVEDAVRQSEDALAVALDGYLSAGRDFPLRTEVLSASATVVEIPIRPIVAARWLLIGEMRRQDLNQVDL